jgi:hypothetical protein
MHNHTFTRHLTIMNVEIEFCDCDSFIITDGSFWGSDNSDG